MEEMEDQMSRLLRHVRGHAAAKLIGICAVALAVSLPSLAHATVVTGSSSAYGESVNLTVTPIIGLGATVTSGPLPTAAGTAPAPYNVSNAAISAFVSDVLATGVLNVNAFSNVDGLPGSRTTGAASSVNGLSIGSLGGLLNLASTTLQSVASVTGDFGALLASGTTTIQGLAINGIPLLVVMPTANDVLFSALGVTITANEQILSGDGINSAGIIVNALDISFANAIGVLNGVAGFINGNIIIGQSQAFASAVAAGGGGPVGVPEPSSLIILGMGLVSFVMLRRSPMFGNRIA
jgi:hypothetical protein